MSSRSNKAGAGSAEAQAWADLEAATVRMIQTARAFQAAVLNAPVAATIEDFLTQHNIPVRRTASASPLLPPQPLPLTSSIASASAPPSGPNPAAWLALRRAARQFLEAAQDFYEAAQETGLGATIEDTLAREGITVGRFYMSTQPSTTASSLPWSMRSPQPAPLLPSGHLAANTASRLLAPSGASLFPAASSSSQAPQAHRVASIAPSSAASTSASRLPALPPLPHSAATPASPSGPPAAMPNTSALDPGAAAQAYYASLHETKAPKFKHPPADKEGRPQCQRCEGKIAKGSSWRYWWRNPRRGRVCCTCYALSYQAIKRVKKAYAEQHGLSLPEPDAEGDGHPPQPTLAPTSSPQPAQPTGLEAALTGLFQVPDPLEDPGDDEGSEPENWFTSALPSIGAPAVLQTAGPSRTSAALSTPAIQERTTGGHDSEQDTGDEDEHEQDQVRVGEEGAASEPPRKRRKPAPSASGRPSTRSNSDRDDPGNSPAASSAGISTRSRRRT